MAPPTLPSFIGAGYPVVRTPIWSTISQDFVSGKRALFPMWSSPRYKYTIPINVLRLSNLEWQTLVGFFNLVNGSAGLFQYFDPNFNSATNQLIGVSDGNTSQYQLLSTLPGSGFAEPVYAITGSPQIFINGSPSPPAGGISPYGVVTFGAPVPAGQNITWTGTFNWYCRFDKDTLDFEQFVSNMARVKTLEFTTEKFTQ